MDTKDRKYPKNRVEVSLYVSRFFIDIKAGGQIQYPSRHENVLPFGYGLEASKQAANLFAYGELMAVLSCVLLCDQVAF
jgi:hypothetical protein